MRRFIVFSAGYIWLGGQICAQTSEVKATEAAQHALLLERISQRMMGNLKRQPNYTCIETVERSHHPATNQKFQLVDTIRLEVALVDGKEMYGWPGAKKFENTELRDIVGGGGAISNGDFALHARAIFGGGVAAFEYRGAGETAGRTWVRFDYHVAQSRSDFELRVGDRNAIVGYRGFFEADPASLDVETIEVIADEIPSALGVRRTTDHLEYARARIGDSDFLLPSESELTMSNSDGSESRNRTRFASCRQFTGESVLRFDDAPTLPNAPPPIEDIELPPALDMTLTLIDDIDLKKAAIGDPVRARLENDLKSQGRVLLAKHAIAIGHLARMERHTNWIMVGLIFEDLESPAARTHVRLQLAGVYGAENISQKDNYLSSNRLPNEGIIPVRISHARLSRGLTMLWNTEP